MWKKISFVAVLVLLACAASSAALLRGNDVTVVQHVPTQTVVTAEAGTGGAASPCGCCGVATCSCCNKEPAFQRPRSFRATPPGRHPRTCNGARADDGHPSIDRATRLDDRRHHGREAIAVSHARCGESPARAAPKWWRSAIVAYPFLHVLRR